VPHIQRAAASLADDGKRFDEEVIKRGPFSHPLSERLGFRAELLVREHLNLRFERVDVRDERTKPLQLPFVLSADDLRKDLTEHARRARGTRRVFTDFNRFG
jgi:hypothetical protein